MPGLPLFSRTRFKAARQFWRSHTSSIKPLLAPFVPERSFPSTTGGASTRPGESAASPLAPPMRPSFLGFCDMASPRETGVSLFPSFGPSPERTLATTTLLTSRSTKPVPHGPFRRKARSPQVRTSAFTARPPDLRRLALITRALRTRARSPCLASPHIRFLFVGLQLRAPLPSRRLRRSAVCFARRDQLTRGLSPPSRCPCWAH
jgi:hypothetical protein